jgi:hypothetical protein
MKQLKLSPQNYKTKHLKLPFINISHPPAAAAAYNFQLANIISILTYVSN